MNEDILNSQDESIRRLLAEAVAPQSLIDADIEAMLTSADIATPLSDKQLHRLVGKVQRLIETADAADRTVTFTAMPAVVVSQSTHHASQPRLVVVSTTDVPLRGNRKAAIASLLASLLALISVVVLSSNVPVPRAISQNDQRSKLQGTLLTDLQRQQALQRTIHYQMTAKPMPETPTLAKVAVGDEISTGELERRRVSLPDGSVLYVNSNAQVKIVSERRVEVTKGEVFVEVVPAFFESHGANQQVTVDAAVLKTKEQLPAASAVPLRFEVVTPTRTITALGTKFAVKVDDSETDVMVTQGKVQVSGVKELVTAGTQLRTGGEAILTAAPSASSQLEWTRDLMAAATGPLVAKSEYSGGALVTVDPNGQSSKLSLRNYHIDVHIEDGFARTTIDQTYFNHTHSRLEGTFHFPLPTDASLSRLAMYVNGKLMEGGMAERNHARNTFEEIKRKMLDPALLEWVDGSTFKMRVFPLEPRQEKRIVLSYSQRLPSRDGQLSYRFPAGHTMDAVKDWSAHVVVKGAAGSEWKSQSHAMTAKNEGDDLVLDAALKNALLDQDLVLRIRDCVPSPPGKGEKVAERPDEGAALGGVSSNQTSSSKSHAPLTLALSPESGERGQQQFSSATSDGQQYLMLRLRPDLAGDMQRKPHHWVFLFEHGGDRTPLLARTQIEIIRTLLENAEHSDTFSIVTASSRAALYSEEPQVCSAENMAAAIKYLENVHLVGALDLAAGLKKCRTAFSGRPDENNSGSNDKDGLRRPSYGNAVLIHVGSGMPALGERDLANLAELIPKDVEYIGIGVGRRWNEAMMKQTASRTGGVSAQINPDEDIAWRAFDVFNKLHSPRLVNVSVTRDQANAASAGPSPAGKGEKVADRPDEGAASGNASSNQIPNPESQNPLTLTLSPESGERGLSQPRFLLFSDTITHGEELAAICRIPEGQPLPKELTVTATLNGQPWSQSVAVGEVEENASYLPRHWAKLEIDRLLAENAQQNRDAIIALSKSMYVLSPFTSLLVLENDEMYTQFNVDRGRKDHWALYACPQTIEVVSEDGGEAAVPAESVTTSDVKTPADVMSTVVRLPGATFLPMHSITLTKLDPMATVKALRRLYSGIGASSPVFLADLKTNRILVAGTDRQILQTKTLLNKLDANNLGNVHNMPLFSDIRYRLDLSGILNGHSRFPAAVQYPYYSFRGPTDFFVKPMGEASRRWSTPRFDTYFDVDSHADGIQEGVWMDLDSSMLNSFDSTSYFGSAILSDGRERRWDENGNSVVVDDFIPLFRLPAGVDFDSNSQGIDHTTFSAKELESLGSTSLVTPRYFQPRYDLERERFLIENSGDALNPETWDWQTLSESGPWSTPDDSVADLNSEGSLPEMANGYVRDINVILDGDHRRTKHTVPLDRLQIQPGDLADPRRIRRGQSRFTGERMLQAKRGGFAYFSANPPNDIVDKVSSFRIRRSLPPEISLSHAQAVSSHRWAADAIGSDTALVKLPKFHQVTDNSIEINPTMFGDLISHAPGLNTSAADVMAVVEAEASISNLKFEISNPPAGRVDEAARGLIEKARSRSWESIVLPGRDGEAGVTVLYDGKGRHVWERVVSEGLREHVVCDGATLWHVYREIGLASKRPFSRFHHREFSNVVPWLLPSVEELSRGADVVAVNERTVAIRGTAFLGRPDKDKLNSEDQDGLRRPSYEIPNELHLVFADDGRLAERRIVECDGGKVLQRITYDADGLVKVLDGEDKELLAAKFDRSIAAEPQLVPDLSGLVVLPMPVRTPEAIIARTTDKDGKVTADADLSEDDAISLMLAYMANGNGDRVVDIARSRFVQKNDTRDGLYVLLNRFPMALVQAAMPNDPASTDGKSPGFDLRPPVEGSPLKQFVRQYINWLRDLAPWQPGSGGISEFRIDAPEDSFLQRLAKARNLYVRWLTDAATTDLTRTQVQQEVDHTLGFIATCRTLDMGWALMNTMRPRLTTPEHLAAFAKAAQRFEQHPQVGLLVRRERMTALLAAGKHDEAMTLFKEWLSVQLQQGSVPPIGKAFYDSLTANNYQQTMNDFLLAEANQLADSGLLMMLNSFAVQMRELGNVKIADQMITKLLATLNTQHRPDVSLYAIEQLRQMKDVRADKLLDQVMELPMAERIPQLWRFASELAEESGRKRLAVERLEHAIQLEFATRPTTINIETVRSDYKELLGKFEELITAAATLEVAPPDGLAASIIQAADQWRTLDEDDTTACQTASRLLAKLNNTDVAWDYLVTPLAENSGESGPWIELARRLGNEKQIDLADMAWSRAFEFESTNPEILLDHAILLQSAGRSAQAKAVLQRVSDGTWQPRFSGSVQKIQELLQTL